MPFGGLFVGVPDPAQQPLAEALPDELQRQRQAVPVAAAGEGERGRAVEVEDVQKFILDIYGIYYII